MGHFVYFVSTRERKGTQPVKIGYSKNPNKRLKSLQTGYPNKLEIMKKVRCGTEKDARKLEKTIHWFASRKFQGLNGEWFIIKGSWQRLIEDSLKMCRVEVYDLSTEWAREIEELADEDQELTEEEQELELVAAAREWV